MIKKTVLLANVCNALRMRTVNQQTIHSESQVEVQADDFNILNVPDEMDNASFFKKPKEVNAIQ